MRWEPIGRTCAQRALGLLAAALLVGPAGGMAGEVTLAKDAGKKGEVKESGVTLKYRHVPIQRVLDYLTRESRGMNIKIQADDPAEEEELKQTPVTVDLANVSWRAALDYVAGKARFVINKEHEASGLLTLERPPRITMNVQNAKL